MVVQHAQRWWFSGCLLQFYPDLSFFWASKHRACRIPTHYRDYPIYHLYPHGQSQKMGSTMAKSAYFFNSHLPYQVGNSLIKQLVPITHGSFWDTDYWDFLFLSSPLWPPLILSIKFFACGWPQHHMWVSCLTLASRQITPRKALRT